MSVDNEHLTSDPAPPHADRAVSLRACAFFLLLATGMFARVLFAADDRVLSLAGTDLFSQFVHYHDFGFRELRGGNLALWNPLLFCGLPYFGGMQSALLYPPNWLFLILPLHRAFNIVIVFHVFLAGFTMHAWAARRRLHPVACLLSGVMCMFGGTFFLHIYPGHLPNLSAMPWLPVIMMSLDGWRDDARPRWLLLGMAAATMQILAGHPQYVFYTAVTAGLYTVAVFLREPRRWGLPVALSAIYAGAALLSACQLLTAWSAAGESVRGGGTPLEFSAMFSFPPENLLTLLMPGFFGDLLGTPYWGRCYLWEMTPFIGTIGLLLAIVGIRWGTACQKRHGTLLVVLLALLALGAHMPWFPWLHAWVPGFDRFRGNSKFIFPAAVFLCMLAAAGLHQLMHGRVVPRWIAGTAITLATLSVGGAVTAVLVRSGAADAWLTACVKTVHATGESELPAIFIADPGFVGVVARHVSWELFRLTVILLPAAVLLWIMPSSLRSRKVCLPPGQCYPGQVYPLNPSIPPTPVTGRYGNRRSASRTVSRSCVLGGTSSRNRS